MICFEKPSHVLARICYIYRLLTTNQCTKHFVIFFVFVDTVAVQALQHLDFSFRLVRSFVHSYENINDVMPFYSSGLLALDDRKRGGERETERAVFLFVDFGQHIIIIIIIILILIFLTYTIGNKNEKIRRKGKHEKFRRRKKCVIHTSIKANKH